MRSTLATSRAAKEAPHEALPSAAASAARSATDAPTMGACGCAVGKCVSVTGPTRRTGGYAAAGALPARTQRKAEPKASPYAVFHRMNVAEKAQSIP